MMTPKKRILAALRGHETDRVPWSPFLAYYWESLPKATQERGQLAWIEAIGADPLLRGFVQLFSVKHRRCEVTKTTNGRETFTEYKTPVGVLRAKHVYTPTGNTWFMTEHPVKTEENFKTLTYIQEDAIIVPNYEAFNHDWENLGERGLHLPVIGSDLKTPFQSLLETWAGTENLVYALADFPETVEDCLNAMRENSLKAAVVSVESKAEGFIFWEDSSTTNTSPDQFLRYALPDINAWGNIIHNAGKLHIHHACGHLKALLPHIACTNIDAVESISPPPTGNVEVWDARKTLPPHIGIIGGIEPTVFLNSTMESLELYIRELLSRMKGGRYILANSDSCPPGVAYEKFLLVSRIVREHGRY